MKKLLIIIVFLFSLSSIAQKTVCDCVNVTIEIFRSLERGASEKTIEIRYQKQTEICENLNNTLGDDEFQKIMMKCDSFQELTMLMMGGNPNIKADDEICYCVNLSIRMFEDMKQGMSEKDVEKKYEKKGEPCKKLSEKLGEEAFGQQAMGCEEFSKLMDMLMSEME